MIRQMLTWTHYPVAHPYACSMNQHRSDPKLKNPMPLRYAVIFHILLSVAINTSSLVRLSLSLQPYFGSFGAIIRRRCLLEPWVLQGLMGSYPLIWIIDEDLLEKIKEVLGELAGLGDDFLHFVRSRKEK